MKYRKKPIEVEAFCWTPDCELPDWAEGKVAVYPKMAVVFTLEGAMQADPGDYIIQGIEGEVYPCKPGIFGKTYDPVEDGRSSYRTSLTHQTRLRD